MKRSLVLRLTIPQSSLHCLECTFNYCITACVHGPVLFSVFINNLDLDTGLEGILNKFDSHTKLGGTVKSLESREAFTNEITNQVKSNKGKGWILGWANPGCVDRLGNEMQESKTESRKGPGGSWWMGS